MPFGAPASNKISATFNAHNGVISDGLKTIEFPQANAGAPFQHAICVG